MRFKILGSLIQILPIRSKFSFKPVFSYGKKKQEKALNAFLFNILTTD